MKTVKTFMLAVGILLASTNSKAQTTAMNFSITDCNAMPHDLYSDLDAGKAVILEFFMLSCSGCVVAGDLLEPMKANILAQYPGMLESYAFGYSDSYTCTNVLNWVTTNGYTSYPCDSGALQVAYYGGMGMPTIVIIGGAGTHDLLSAPYVGFATSDTTTVGNDIRNFLGGLSVAENKNSITQFNVFPNPTNSDVNLTFNLTENGKVIIDILDLSGRLVTNLSNEKMAIGKVNKTISTSAIESGNYLLRVNVNGNVSQQKLNVIH